MVFSAKIDLHLASKLEKDLKEQGFTLTQPEHTLFAAKKKGISCTLYTSGSLVVQGKEIQEFIEFYLEPHILQTFSYSHPEAGLDLNPRIGMDEAGKGDFFGPLCVAAVFADEEGIRKLRQLGAKDSKKFSDEKIRNLAGKIRQELPFTIIRFFPQKYNELYGKFKNLNRLLGWAHACALKDLSAKTGCKRAILDQFAEKGLMQNLLKQKKLDIDLEQKVRGEEDVVVAAASILARASFLDGMRVLGEKVKETLPKGASEKVKEMATKLKAKFGPQILEELTKTHFKTTGDL